MLELDECSQLLVTNPFADDDSATSPGDNHDTLVTLTLNSSSEHHPLRSRSVSPAGGYNTPSIPSVTVIGSEDETQPRLTGLLSLDEVSADVTAEGDRTTTSNIIHPVGPNDSLASVALRYDVSIAALRRTNQLWPSDPIHLRTELSIPRGVAFCARRKPTPCADDRAEQSPVQPPLGLSPDPLVSSFVTARNMILSVLPARISMESLSSKASASEDHELDDFQKTRAPKTSATETPLSQEGYELLSLAAPHAHYKRPGVPPQSPSNKHMADNCMPPAGDSHLPSIPSSPAVSLDQLSRTQPFAAHPVRTSQLEPEPAMELPVRRSCINDHHFWMDGTPHLMHSSRS